MTSPVENRDDPLEWAGEHTPVLTSLAEEYDADQPFDGLTVGIASHLEADTGVFIETIRRGGAEVLFTANDPTSIHEPVVEELAARSGYTAFVEPDMSQDELADAHDDLLAAGPDLLLDDGGVLSAAAHYDHPEIAADVIGAAEQTTSGVHRYQAMADDGVLDYPVYAANHTPMKHYFDNVHGTGESALSNAMLTTNSIVAGSTVVVVGYGYVGRGIAQKARALGAETIVSEVDSRKAIEAHMHGHDVLPLAEAAPAGDLFITATGTCDAIRAEHFRKMSNGAQLANAGHYNVEVAVDDLEALAEHTSSPRDGVTRYHLPDSRHLDLLAEGNLVNLSGPYSQGHPAAVMDTTFAVMAECGRDLVERGESLAADVHSVPERLDRRVGRRKLHALDLEIDSLTSEQEAYLDSWKRDLTDD